MKELRTINTLEELFRFIESKDNFWIGFNKNGVKDIVNKTIDITTNVNSKMTINWMFMAFAFDREGTEKELRKKFSEWLASKQMCGVSGQENKEVAK